MLCKNLMITARYASISSEATNKTIQIYHLTYYTLILKYRLSYDSGMHKIWELGILYTLDPRTKSYNKKLSTNSEAPCHWYWKWHHIMLYTHKKCQCTVTQLLSSQSIR